VTVGDVSQTDDETYIYDENGNLLPTRVEYEHGSDSVEIGSKLSPSIKVYPKGAVTNFKFHSSDTSVAKVSSKGTVLGVGEGTCEIYVKTDNGCMASFTVTVFKERFSGIDVSKWNGDIDWGIVSQNPDVDFVMIRASYGTETEDIRLAQNVAGCEAYSIPYGFYHYMYAKSVEEALIEADFFLKTVRPYDPTYPLVLDIEESFYKSMTKEEVTDIVCAFMEKLENAGYYAMIYSYASFFGDSLIYDRVKIYDNWVACWGDQERLSSNFSYSYGMWQYSETGRMDGIPEDVDLNYSYKNYPYIITKYGLTGYNNLGDAPEDDDISWYTEVYEVTE
ncbi:MAG: GH25 family lysozyme, partial [Oscillospiraceae bacterium]